MNNRQIIIKNQGSEQVIPTENVSHLSFNEDDNSIAINHIITISDRCCKGVAKEEVENAFNALRKFIFEDMAHTAIILDLGEKVEYLGKGKTLVELHTSCIENAWYEQRNGWFITVEHDGGISDNRIIDMAKEILEKEIGSFEVEYSHIINVLCEPEKKITHIRTSYR